MDKEPPDAEKNPFEDLMDKLGNLVQFIENNASQPINSEKLTPDVQQKLEVLEKQMQEFTRISENILTLSEVPKEELKKRIAGISDEIPVQAQKLIEKGEGIKNQVEGLREKLKIKDNAPLDGALEVPQGKELSAEEKEAADKKSSARRRRKFRRFGL